MRQALANSRIAKFETGRWPTITSAQFRERARQYRFAAAVTDSSRDVEMFCGLATTFDRLAEDFGRLERENLLKRPAPNRDVIAFSAHIAARSPSATGALVGGGSCVAVRNGG